MRADSFIGVSDPAHPIERDVQDHHHPIPLGEFHFERPLEYVEWLNHEYTMFRRLEAKIVEEDIRKGWRVQITRWM